MRCLQILYTLSAVTLIAGAAACGSSTTEEAPSTSPATTSQAPESTHHQGPGTSPKAPGPTQPMMPNPNGDGSMVPCEGTICTNPNHGAGDNPDENGGAVMPNPNGDGSDVPCEGTICTNPNNGAGDDGNR